MSCKGDCKEKGECKCAYTTLQIWTSIKMNKELIDNFQCLDVYFNGCLLTPSFIFGERGSGDYDLVDGKFLVFAKNMSLTNAIVNIRLFGARYIYLREEYGWKLMILER